MQRSIEKDRLYVMDRGYAKFALFNAIVTANSSYVCRLRDNTVCEIIEQRELTDGDQSAGVISDQIVSLGGSSSNSAGTDHKVRLVEIRCTPHRNRTGGKPRGSKAPNCDGVLRVATNLLDVPAEIIGLIYSYRWAIEIFFRFYKQLMGGSHLISHNANGIEIQVYCSMIACLLINLWTGTVPNKRTFEMISFYFQGLASEDELLAHIDKQRAAEETKRKKAEAAKTN
jgi:IS4 transposase